MDDEDEFSSFSDSDPFFDAPEEFLISDESDSSIDLSEPSTSDRTGDAPPPLPPRSHDQVPPLSGTSARRRRFSAPTSSSSRRTRQRDVTVGSETTESAKARRGEVSVTSKEEFQQQPGGGGDSSDSGVTSDRASPVTDSKRKVTIEGNALADLDTGRHSPSGVLAIVAGLAVKAVSFQISLLIGSILFPFRLMHCAFMLVVDPFGTMRRGRDRVIDVVFGGFDVLRDKVGPLVFQWLGKQQAIGRVALRFGLACFWASYVCIVMFGCLIMAFAIGRLVMHYVVEKPVQIEEDLVFDYTKDSPVALVPITSCQGFQSGSLDYNDAISKAKGTRWRRIPPNHRLQLTVSLTLPESDYNRKLGIFQVRVEFLSTEGKVIASSSRPCMLMFKSSPIRLVETFFKSFFLLAGYTSESQIVRLKMKGFLENEVPTACIRAVIQQRAEYRPAAGIPEIYVATLKLESDLCLVKRIIWNWRWTLFIWISMGVFLSELLIILACCRPLIFPRITAGHTS